MKSVLLVCSFIFIEESIYLIYHFWKKKQTVTVRLQQFYNEGESCFSKDDISFIKQEAKRNSNFDMDDITWNDLTMDEVYKKVNHCLTAAGDHCLYEMLRNPIQNKEEIEHKYRLLEHLRSDEALCTKLTSIFMTVDNYDRDSLYALYDFDFSISKKMFIFLCSLSLILAFVCIISLVYPFMITYTILLAPFNCMLAFRLHKKLAHVYSSTLQLYQYVNMIKRLYKMPLPPLLSDFLDIDSMFVKLKKMRFSFFEDFYSGDGFLLLLFANVFLLGPISYYRLAKQMLKQQKEIEEAVRLCGSLDVYLSIARYLSYTPTCKAEFITEHKYTAKQMVHPLLIDPIANDVHLQQNILISGSNASGKSTYLKMIAVNGVFAQNFGYAFADSYEASLFHIFTSMSIPDQLEKGDSYFVAELRSLKRIMDAIREGKSVLCMIDEILNGTNTKERIAASSEILYEVSHASGLCLCATHDIELTHILKNHYQNLHFKEEYKDGVMYFSYKVYQGQADSQNAIALLDTLGFNKTVVMEAKAQIEAFHQTMCWLTLKDEVSEHA